MPNLTSEMLRMGTDPAHVWQGQLERLPVETAGCEVLYYEVLVALACPCNQTPQRGLGFLFLFETLSLRASAIVQQAESLPSSGISPQHHVNQGWCRTHVIPALRIARSSSTKQGV